MTIYPIKNLPTFVLSNNRVNTYEIPSDSKKKHRGNNIVCSAAQRSNGNNR